MAVTIAKRSSPGSTQQPGRADVRASEMRSTAGAAKTLDRKHQNKKIVSAKPKGIPGENAGVVEGAVDFLFLYKASPEDRVQIIRHGVWAVEVKKVARMMGLPQDKYNAILNLSTATLNRIINKNEGLSPADSERVIGMSTLIGQVQDMVEGSGNPEGFDAAKWLSQWLNESIPALGGKRPSEYMDTIEGQRIVSNLLATMQSGAYA
jgi:uncharacterized protein (DUF2384 family)